MRSIFLHGSLKVKFGYRLKLDVANPLEAIRALASQLPGFRAAISQGSFKIASGSSGNNYLSSDALSFQLNHDDIHIIPALTGSGGKGFVIAGVALLTIATIATWGTSAGFNTPIINGMLTWGNVASAGLSLTAGGVAQMMAKVPDSPTGANRIDKNASSSLGGQAGLGNQGNPVPLVYGQFLVTGTPISSAIMSESY